MHVYIRETCMSVDSVELLLRETLIIHPEITFMSHISPYLVLIQTLFLCSLIPPHSLFLPFAPDLCLSLSCSPSQLCEETKSVGGQSQSLSRFKVPFLPPLPSLLHCSTCCCLIKLFHFLPHPPLSLSPFSLPPPQEVSRWSQNIFLVSAC